MKANELKFVFCFNEAYVMEIVMLLPFSTSHLIQFQILFSFGSVLLPFLNTQIPTTINTV